MTREATPLDVIEGRARWCVVCGDAMVVARSMPDASVDAVVMDPPYGVKIAEWDDDIPPQSWLDECLRVSRGPVLWFGAASKALDFGRYSPRPDRMLVWAPSFALSCSAAHGLMFRWLAHRRTERTPEHRRERWPLLVWATLTLSESGGFNAPAEYVEILRLTETT